MIVICSDCGEVARYRKTNGKYECINANCKNNCLTTGTQESNKLNGFTTIFSN